MSTKVYVTYIRMVVVVGIEYYYVDSLGTMKIYYINFIAMSDCTTDKQGQYPQTPALFFRTCTGDDTIRPADYGIQTGFWIGLWYYWCQ